jgi:PAS domain S-box-containing protein
MEDSFVLGLLQNAALLLSFSMIYHNFLSRREKKRNLFFDIGSGVFLGVLGIVLILTPWTFRSGLIFDTRSVLLSVSGLFLGPVSTLVSILIIAAYRLSLGGAGIWMGVAVIVTSGTIGILWRHFRPGWRKKNQFFELAAMGITVHVVMLACTFLLPQAVRVDTFQNIFFSVLVLYPAATVLLGLLMIRQAQSWENKKALDISEERWKFAIEGAGDGLWDWNPLTNEVFFSKQWKLMLGYKEDELENNYVEWESRIYPDDKEDVLYRINRMLSGEDTLYETEYRMLCKKGTYKWILARGKIMKWNENGHPLRCIGTHKDIDERKKVEQELIDNERYTSSILSAIPDLIFVFSTDGTYLDFKSGDARNLATAKEEFLDKNVFDVLPKRVASKIMTGIKWVLKNNESYLFEYELKIDGHINCFECNLLPFGDTKVIAVVRNTTKRKQVEETLRSSQEQLKNFAAHLQNVREEERILLAREIHDELGQILVAIKIDLGLLGQKAQKHIDNEASEDLTMQFQRLSGLVNNTIETTRRIMTDLRPEVLDLLGFVEAARLHIRNFEERYGIECHFENDVSALEVDSQRSVALFRILQESLTNIAKHAQATVVRVHLGIVGEKLFLEIADNGVGFDSRAKVRDDSYGLIGMRERAFLLDGKLVVVSKPGKGTTVRIEMPFFESANQSLSFIDFPDGGTFEN